MTALLVVASTTLALSRHAVAVIAAQLAKRARVHAAAWLLVSMAVLTSIALVGTAAARRGRDVAAGHDQCRVHTRRALPAPRRCAADERPGRVTDATAAARWSVMVGEGLGGVAISLVLGE